MITCQTTFSGYYHFKLTFTPSFYCKDIKNRHKFINSCACGMEDSKTIGDYVNQYNETEKINKNMSLHNFLGITKVELQQLYDAILGFRLHDKLNEIIKKRYIKSYVTCYFIEENGFLKVSFAFCSYKDVLSGNFNKHKGRGLAYQRFLEENYVELQKDVSCYNTVIGFIKNLINGKYITTNITSTRNSFHFSRKIVNRDEYQIFGQINIPNNIIYIDHIESLSKHHKIYKEEEFYEKDLPYVKAMQFSK